MTSPRPRPWKGGEVSWTDDEICSGWMTTRDAELLGVLAKGLNDDERRQVAEAISLINTQADQQVRRSKGRDRLTDRDPHLPRGRLARTTGAE